MSVKPFDSFIHKLIYLIYFFLFEPTFKFFIRKTASYRKRKVFKIFLRFCFLFNIFLFIFVKFSILNKRIYFFLWKSSFRMSYSNFIIPRSHFINCRDFQNTIFINIKWNLNLRNSPWGWGNTIKAEFSKHVIILSNMMFTLK